MKLTRMLTGALCALALVLTAVGASADEERPREGRDAPREGRDAPREGRDAPREGRDAPGRDAPGRDAPGRDAPGRDAPGRDAPGRDAPGRDAPREGREGQGDWPVGLTGFDGNVRVVVLERGNQNNALVKVIAVNRVWEETNKAKVPRQLANRVIEIRPMPGREGEGGKDRELQAALINKLRPRQEGHLNVRHAEGRVFFITELSPDQKAYASGEYGEGERREFRSEGREFRSEGREFRPEGREFRPFNPERRER